MSLRLRAAFATQLEVIAAPVHFQDVGVMGEPVEQSASEAFGAEQSGNQDLLASAVLELALSVGVSMNGGSLLVSSCWKCHRANAWLTISESWMV